MGQHSSGMRQKIKNAVSFLVILILLPYVISVFINGADMKAGGKNNSAFVRVRVKAADGTEKIKNVSWEEYFIGVLAKEMPVSYEDEALKAQAVLIRTNLYRTLGAGGAGEAGDTVGVESKSEDGKNVEKETTILEEGYFTFKELEQKWPAEKYDSCMEKLRNAMAETENQVLFYGDSYALVPFHHSSSGKTRSGEEVLGTAEYPYLAVRDCPLDKEADDEMQVLLMEYQEIQAKCQPFLVAVAKENAEKTYQFSDFEIQSYDSAGYVQSIRIGETVLSGEQFREALSLPSSAFSIQDVGGKLQITTAGRGHGLGMSQWTAQEMAKEGKSYEEILQYFFEGTNLTNDGKIFTNRE